MKRQYVTDQEASFVVLVARRILNYQRVAAKEGEVYHDLAPLAPLGCGVRVKMRFEGDALVPTVYVKAGDLFSKEEVKTIAEELLGAPATYREHLDDGTAVYQKESL